MEIGNDIHINRHLNSFVHCYRYVNDINACSSGLKVFFLYINTIHPIFHKKSTAKQLQTYSDLKKDFEKYRFLSLGTREFQVFLGSQTWMVSFSISVI